MKANAFGACSLTLVSVVWVIVSGYRSKSFSHLIHWTLKGLKHVQQLHSLWWPVANEMRQFSSTDRWGSKIQFTQVHWSYTEWSNSHGVIFHQLTQVVCAILPVSLSLSASQCCLYGSGNLNEHSPLFAWECSIAVTEHAYDARVFFPFYGVNHNSCYQLTHHLPHHISSESRGE